MPNDILQLRRKNVLGSQSNPYAGIFDERPNPPSPYDDLFQTAPISRDTIDPRQPITEPTRTGGVGYDDIMNTINKLYSPDYTSRDRLNRLLDNAPELQEPSTGRRITAAMAGFHQKDGAKITQDILDAPNKAAQTAFTNKAQPFGQAAQIENTANVNERTLAGNVVGAETARMKQESTERIASEKADIARYRARAYDYAQRLGKGYQFDVTGTTVKVFNKDTGDTVDTGVPTGKLDEETKIDMQNYGRIEAARQRAESSAANTRAAGAQILMGPDGTPYSVNPRESTGKLPDLPSGPFTRPGTPPRTNADTPGNVAAAHQNKLREIYDNNSDLQEFFKSTGGKLELNPRPTRASKIEGWERARKLAYPSKDTNLGVSGSVYDPDYSNTPDSSPQMGQKVVAGTAMNPSSNSGQAKRDAQGYMYQRNSKGQVRKSKDGVNWINVPAGGQ